ncbi:MAG TPA: hypothetical protein VMZ71_06155 [Gemmataceae bacterium]|nr:hypothetical protein [Gemmataceae bacterium]
MKLSRLALVAFVALLVGFGHAQEKPKPPAPQPKKQTVMQRKLTHAQKLLEGLAVADFAKLTAAADELALCAQEASWRAANSPKFETHSNNFVRNLEALKKAAKAKNVDAAALAYVDMTLTCVKCHQQVREEGIGLAPTFDAKAFAAK